MTVAEVGTAFCLAVLAREAYHLGRPHYDARQAAKAECARVGHQWGEPFTAMEGRHRSCQRCKKQQHWSPVAEEWI